MLDNNRDKIANLENGRLPSLLANSSFWRRFQQVIPEKENSPTKKADTGNIESPICEYGGCPAQENKSTEKQYAPAAKEKMEASVNKILLVMFCDISAS